MTTFASAQSLPVPKAVTDPKQLQTTRVEDLQTFTIEKLYNTRLIGGSTWSPDGRQVAFISNITGRDNLWLIPAAGGWPVQLTIGDQRQASPAWSPDGKWIAYMSDYDGDELWDIYLVSPANGEVVNLTASRKTAEEAPAWSPDGKQIAYMTKAKDSPSFEIDVVDVETRKTRHITRNSPRQLGNMSPIWSRDGKLLAWTQQHASGKDSNILMMELASGTVTNLTEHSGDKLFSAEHFSPDAKQILVTSDAANGYENVGLLDLATKKIKWLTQDKWEISAGDFSPDGRSLTWTANVDGNQDVYLHELASGKTSKLALPEGWNYVGGNPSGFTSDGTRMLYYHEGPTAPRDLWSYDLKAKTSAQLTNSLFGGVRGKDMVEPVLVHYPSHDGKFTISAFAYVPHNIQRNAKYPAIVYIHGGPTAQSTNRFNRSIQYLLNQGYLVIAPNYRGSTGYGQQFQDANRKDAGGGELQDVIGAAEFIKQSGFVDPKKLIVMGGSYGGYLSMMAVTKAPDMWAAGVPIVPFVNWFTEFQNEDPELQEFDRLFMGDPEKDKALWEDRSPVNFLDKVKAPLLLLAGGNDPRCPKSEAQQVADAIKKRGGRVQLKIYENEGHGFARVENQVDAYKRVADFLKINVPSPGCGCTVFE
jgi:dipeptidyl aminopeptidase/acylaminoacyl peptidase